MNSEWISAYILYTYWVNSFYYAQLNDMHFPFPAAVRNTDRNILQGTIQLHNFHSKDMMPNGNLESLYYRFSFSTEVYSRVL